MKTRAFGEGTTARHVVAEAIARRRLRSHIAPMDWSEAGIVIAALKDNGFDVLRRLEVEHAASLPSLD